MGSGVSTHKVLHNWHHADPDDAAKEIWEALGDITAIELAGHQIMTASYVRPATTTGGIITPGSAQNEDIYQGTVALIVKMGPRAFEGMDDDWPSGVPKLGDWIYFRPQDSVMCSVKGPGSEMRKDNRGRNMRDFDGWECRLVYARDVYARVTLPHIII